MVPLWPAWRARSLEIESVLSILLFLLPTTSSAIFFPLFLFGEGFYAVEFWDHCPLQRLYLIWVASLTLAVVLKRRGTGRQCEYFVNNQSWFNIKKSTFFFSLASWSLSNFFCILSAGDVHLKARNDSLLRFNIFHPLWGRRIRSSQGNRCPFPQRN